MAIIGLDNLHYAPMTTEDTATTQAVYGTPKRLVGIVSVDMSPENDTATLYGDNMAMATISKTKKRSITLEIADLPLEDEAALLGHTYDSETGVMTVKGDDKAPYVAIMFDADTHDEKKQYTVFYKGKFAEAQHTDNTDGESTEFSLHNLEGTFVARTYDKKVYDKRVTTDPSVATSWYASVGNTGSGSDNSSGDSADIP